MKTLWLAILLSLTACKDRITVQNVLIIDSTDDNADPSSPITSKSNSQLMGIWTEGSTENATFAIASDSIFYVEDNLVVPYFLSGDSIRIIFPTHTYNALFAFEKDTLVLFDAYGDSKYWRFKN